MQNAEFGIIGLERLGALFFVIYSLAFAMKKREKRRKREQS